jgi:hypothetical protein
MALIGIIPAIFEDESGNRHQPPSPGEFRPYHLTYSIELLPIGVQVDGSDKYFKPLSQVAVEGMVDAGVEHIIMVVTEAKLDVQRFYRDGTFFGVPISYVISCRGPGLSAAVDATYALIQGHPVVMALPGITDRKAVVEVVRAHRGGGSAMALSVSQNTRVDPLANVQRVTRRQMSGVFAWEPPFTELHRELMAEGVNGSGSAVNFEDVVEVAIAEGMRVKAVKLPYTPYVSDCASWSRAVNPNVFELALEDETAD